MPTKASNNPWYISMLVSYVEERSLKETLSQADVSRSYKFDVDLVPDVQTPHEQTDAILGAASSFCVA